MPYPEIKQRFIDKKFAADCTAESFFVQGLVLDNPDGQLFNDAGQRLAKLVRDPPLDQAVDTLVMTPLIVQRHGLVAMRRLVDVCNVPLEASSLVANFYQPHTRQTMHIDQRADNNVFEICNEEGTLVFLDDEGNEQIRTLAVGDMASLPAQLPHRGENNTDQLRISFLVADVTVEKQANAGPIA